jgi:hypothetical protein
MKKWQIERREFLRSAGITISLPFLEQMLPSMAHAASTDPRRFIAMYIPSSTYMQPNDGGNWHPGKSSAALSAASLPPVFSPFASNVNDFSILRSVDSGAFFRCAGGAHSASIATWLTCAPYTDANANNCTAGADSFDQVLGASLGKPAIAMSADAELGGRDGANFNYLDYLSYKGGNPASCYRNPVKMFSLLFNNIAAPSATPTPAPVVPKYNTSVLDNALADIDTLNKKLGKNDKTRMDEYLQQVRDLERKLAMANTGNTGGGGGAQQSSCAKIPQPAANLNNEDSNLGGAEFPDRIKAYCDMIVLAIKCDIGRSFSLLFGSEGDPRRFNGSVPANLSYNGQTLRGDESHLGVAHWRNAGDGDADRRMALCIVRDRYYVSQMIYVINELKKATDPTGSTMDKNTAILVGCGFPDGQHEDYDGKGRGIPLALGGGGNFLKPGNFYVQKADMKDVLFTIAKGVGSNMANFQGSSKVLAI